MQVAGTAAALLWQRGHLAQRTAIACGHSAALHSPPSPAALAARLPPDLPQPLDFEVKQAVFIKSSSETKELPTPVTPGKRFAFPMGRYETRPPIASNGDSIWNAHCSGRCRNSASLSFGRMFMRLHHARVVNAHQRTHTLPTIHAQSSRSSDRPGQGRAA